MLLNTPFLITTSFIVSLFCLLIVREMAKKVGLVDKPNQRKHHQGVIPLVGGIAVCMTIVIYLLAQYSLSEEHLSQSPIYLLCAITLTVIGALDDKYDVSYKTRIIIQAVLAAIMMFFADLALVQLGDMFAIGNIDLGIFGLLITVFAVIGAINAFNMVDGIDGLLGGLSIVTFSGLAYLFKGYESTALLFEFCLIIIAALIPYVLLNLGLLGRKRKVFMGDAGSMLIGFTVIWLLLSGSQIANEQGHTTMRPVTALWLIALPLMDMAAIMMRRIKRGDSPFQPDREHLHHICQRIGLSSVQTLVAICSLASFFVCIGLLGEAYAISEGIMFYGFIAVFLGYYFLLAHVWKFTRFIRKFTKQTDYTYQQES
ncbi:undecaprenyl-phosphate alpha-N-acetylglucosaminyl 1-phosphate transferase [Veronia nyctiphanis]|uniref:Undecaprenyl-phosphate alpha-N-acetylglucosaminyl 1-phosphate transferase n=1 Tax=Veronia nyctiphanis TaxID=1278244 RepID=A0A4Q0YZV0_9GAMM|nr:UDP-N-acetylglucosamine--undecaprenyl-phosphate N-acetylglucosaminephosphotransferase [Veronia nyctiphanis]RXJ74699.1 undecaprenyl-phosphate alpha-N-acetylglucosaminyl 1-phosphate transferase [Veronia nyctiphanis]